MNQSLNDSIVMSLQKHGWARADGAAIATKIYPTAVGPKEALVFAVYSQESGVVVLQGQYWSEGRNVLEPHWTTIRQTAEGASIDKHVDCFATQADAVIADTYAARLLASSSGSS